MIYLDTHVVLLLYLCKGEGLSERARRLIEYEPEILISPIVLLEVDYLHEIGAPPSAQCLYSSIFISKLALKHAKSLSSM